MLDAGCGSGHLGRFLAGLGVEVTGFDIDPEMIEFARSQAPGIRWLRGDLTTIDVGRVFDAVLVSGNVFNFIAPERIPTAVSRMAAHVDRGGWLCASFARQGRFTVADYERWAAGAGLTLDSLASDWAGSPMEADPSEVVAIHRREG